MMFTLWMNDLLFISTGINFVFDELSAKVIEASWNGLNAKQQKYIEDIN
jgi:hypothetical protein